MPLAIVTHGDFLNSDRKERLRELLKTVIAEELDCSATEDDGEGDLTPDEINVSFHPYGPGDVQDYDVHILVIAKWYQSRADNVQKRTERITSRLCSSSFVYPACSIGVFVTLPIAGWSLGYPGD